MHYFSELFHTHPEMAVFLTLALGFWLGNIRFGGRFSLGVVTSTLIAGLIVGQCGVTLPGVMESLFFDIFLFTVGYTVGPLFVRALRGEGVNHVLFTLIVCLSGFGAAWVLAALMGYPTPVAAGLLAGGYTNSSVVGVASGLLNRSTAAALLPVAYAVTYPFGTAGSAWFLSVAAPRLLHVSLQDACEDYEKRHAAGDDSRSAPVEYEIRSFILNDTLAGLSVKDAEKQLGHALFFRQVYSADGNRAQACEAETILKKGDRVTLEGRQDAFVCYQHLTGPEFFDNTVAPYRPVIHDIILNRPSLREETLNACVQQTLSAPAQGVFMTHIYRQGHQVRPSEELRLQTGDIISVRGPLDAVSRLANEVGVVQRKTDRSDMAFMCAGVFLGCLAGTLTVTLHGIPVSLGTSVGAILAGILCGCWHESRPDVGGLPDAAKWVFSNLGMNGFIAVVGINAAPGFVSGLMQYGLSLFLCGAVVTLLPLITGLVLGRYVFKFDPAILLGLCAGARSSTASLGALQEVAKSQVPAIGYTTGYAVSRIVMSVLAIVMVSGFQ
ncbi:aspartate:alanine exchanger family transporter [Pantoea ananatis]|uniref:aspartate:alanine exchanger family transporter n=1 Tax=Pantoea ananas TaxID=553 RepID=UPI001B30AC53|nr:hypothetical protein [Pantoea ananatis]